MKHQEARKLLDQSRGVYVYGKNTGIMIGTTKKEARRVLETMPETLEDDWGMPLVRVDSDNDFIIEV